MVSWYNISRTGKQFVITMKNTRCYLFFLFKFIPNDTNVEVREEVRKRTEKPFKGNFNFFSLFSWYILHLKCVSKAVQLKETLLS